MAGADKGGEVFYEFTSIGRSVKVVAIDAASGTEVSIVAPATLSQAEMQRLALRKLKARLAGGT